MMRDRILQIVLLGFLLLGPALSKAQNFTNHWYFGTTNNLSLRFARGDNSAALVTATHGVFTGQGGSVVVSSPVNGDLLFYTNGTNVFDITHTAMPGGPLTGDVNDNQPVVVGRVPGQQNQYFVITRNAAGAVSVSIVDMSLQGNPGAQPLGEITSTSPLLGAATRSEAMITVPHANGTDFWLITHQNFGGIPEYTAVHFTPTGPDPTIQNTVGAGQILNAGNFAFNPGTNEIVVSPNEPLRDVEVLAFDNTAGTFSLVRTLANSSVPNVAGNNVYDAEWSNNDRYIYVSQNIDGASRILQYNVEDPVTSPPTPVTPEALTLSADIRRSFGLQMAPDSSIYHLYETNGGAFHMGKITNADTIATLAAYVDEAFPGSNFLAKQFPSFPANTNLNLSVDFTFGGLCAGAPTFFTPTVNPQPDSLVWTINGERVHGEWAPSRTFEAGTYNVTVTSFLNGDSIQSQMKAVVIQDPGVQITLDREVTACSSELPEPHDPAVQGCNDLGTPCFTVTASVTGSATLEWFGSDGQLGDTDATLAPESAGFYYLVATAPNGCQVYSPVTVKEYRVPVQTSAIWYFGNNAGIDFNPVFDIPSGPAISITNPVMNAPEGTSTASDQNGQVVLFTDGNQVWDRTFVPLAPVGLGGNVNSAQSVLIVPVEEDKTLFYIFTTQAIPGTSLFEMRYSLFNLRLRNGLGDLVDNDNNPATPPSTVLFTRSTEKLAGDDGWVLAHEYGNNTFRAYQVTAEGILGPIITGIGSDHSALSPESGSGYMVLNGGRLAVALPLATSNVVEVFNFDSGTGIVSNFRSVTVPQASGDVYGVNFGAGGDRLFATVLGDNSIYEFVYDDVTDTYSSLGPIVPAAAAQPGAIQISPLGQLFVALQGQTRLGLISPFSADQTTPSTYTDNGFQLTAGGQSQLGLPNFPNDNGIDFPEPTITSTGVCLHQRTHFTAKGYDPIIDVFSWDFGDGSAGLPPGKIGEDTASYVYLTASTFTTTVTISNKCETYTRDITVTIDPGPDPNHELLVDPNNNVLCPSQTLTAPPGNTYDWNSIPGSLPGEPASVVATEAAVYAVVVTNPSGCSVTLTQPVVRFFQNFDLGEDLILCEGQAHTAISGIQDPTLTYAWTMEQVSPVPTPPAPLVNEPSPFNHVVNTATPGVFRYALTVTAPLGLCTTSDNVLYTISPAPDFTLTPNNPAVCGGPGSIDLTITGPPNTKFRYAVSGPSLVPDMSDLLAGGPPQNIAPLDPGQYFVTVMDQVSQCTIQQTASIFDPTVTAAIVPQSGCEPTLQFSVQTNVIGTYELFELQTGGGSLKVDDGTTINGAVLTKPTANLKSGFSYYAVVKSNATPPCTSVSPTVPIIQNTAYGVSLGNVDCATNSITATILSGAPPAATDFTWSTIPAGGIQSENDATGSAILIPGNYSEVRVVASGVGPTCPGKAFKPVVVTPQFAANITQDPPNGCANTVTLNAAPNAIDFRYSWRKNAGAFAPGGPQIIAQLADHSSIFEVNVVNNNSGCPSNDTHTAQVLGTITVNLGAPILTCLGNDFTLTAVPSKPATSFNWFLNGVQFSGQNASTLTTPAQPGTYSVVAISNGCTSPEDNVIVTPLLPTPVDLGVLKRICPEVWGPPARRTVSLKANPDNLLSYTWIHPFGNSIPPGPEIVADSVGVYTVTAVNAVGCESTDQVEVIYDCDPVITGPNAFRPTSTVVGGPSEKSGNQNFWLIANGIDPESFEIIIFNRWGEMVFQSKDPNFDWNGGHNDNINNPAPAGTYSYVVKYREISANGEPKKPMQEQRGGVLLLR
jgi:large repetitive protein